MSPSRIALAALALAGSVTACGAGGPATNSGGTAGVTTPVSIPDVSGAPTASSVAPNGSAPAALQFAAPAVGGGAIDFTLFAGQPVVLWFWAPT